MVGADEHYEQTIVHWRTSMSIILYSLDWSDYPVGYS